MELFLRESVIKVKNQEKWYPLSGINLMNRVIAGITPGEFKPGGFAELFTVITEGEFFSVGRRFIPDVSIFPVFF